MAAAEKKKTKSKEPEKQVDKRIDSLTRRRFEQRLNGMNQKKLMELWLMVGMGDLPFWETGTKASSKKQIIIDHMMSDKWRDEVRQFLDGKAAAGPSMLPVTRLQLEEVMARTSNGMPRISDLQGWQREMNHGSRKGDLPLEGMQSFLSDLHLSKQPEDEDEQEEASGSPWEFFTVRRPSAKGLKKSLQSLRVGSTHQGRVSGISMLDGVRVDIGAETEVLVPMDLSADQAVLDRVQSELGSEVEVCISQIHTGPAGDKRRFPVIATLIATTDAWESPPCRGGSALQLQRGDDPAQLHEARQDGAPSPVEAVLKKLAEGNAGLSKGDDGRSAMLDKDTLRLLQAARDMPRRPCPKEVPSVDTDGALRVVAVPEDVLASQSRKATKVTDAAAKAWSKLANEELRCLKLEMRCRDQLADDLDAVEADLAAGSPPSVPSALLGMVRVPQSRKKPKVLLAVVAGDSLSFRLRAFQTEEHLNNWAGAARDRIAEAWKAHKQKGESAASKKPTGAELSALDVEKAALTRFFSCKAVCHLRALRAVEADALEREGYAARLPLYAGLPEDERSSESTPDPGALLQQWTRSWSHRQEDALRPFFNGHKELDQQKLSEAWHEGAAKGKEARPYAAQWPTAPTD